MEEPNLDNPDASTLTPRKRKLWRWITFTVGCLMMSVSGTQYMFSVFAPQLKDILGYSQPEINLVGTFGNFGLYFGGILPALFYDKYGARLTALLGSTLMFFGYYMMYSGATNTNLPESAGSFISMSIFMCILGIGSSACYTAALATNVSNSSRRNAGVTVGALVSFSGLCAAIFTQLYTTLFKPDVLKLLLFLSIVLSTTSALGIFFLRKLPPEPAGDETNLLPTQDKKNDFTYSQILRSPDFGILLAVFGMVNGAGFVLINNLGGLVTSLGGEPGDQDPFVIILSLCNCGGRIITGYASDKAAPRISRPWFIFFSCTAMAISNFYLAFTTEPEALYPGVIGVGLSYGAMMSITPTFASEFFGKTHFGGIWALLRLSPGLGSFICSTLITGQLYQLAIEDENDTACFGVACFQNSFLIMMLASVVCALISLVIVKRSRGK